MFDRRCSSLDYRHTKPSSPGVLRIKESDTSPIPNATTTTRRDRFRTTTSIRRSTVPCVTPNAYPIRSYRYSCIERAHSRDCDMSSGARSSYYALRHIKEQEHIGQSEAVVVWTQRVQTSNGAHRTVVVGPVTQLALRDATILRTHLDPP